MLTLKQYLYTMFHSLTVCTLQLQEGRNMCNTANNVHHKGHVSMSREGPLSPEDYLLYRSSCCTAVSERMILKENDTAHYLVTQRTSVSNEGLDSKRCFNLHVFKHVIFLLRDTCMLARLIMLITRVHDIYNTIVMGNQG